VSKNYRLALIVGGLLILLSLVLSFWYSPGRAFSWVFGFFYIFILPGFLWAKAFFPKKTDAIESAALSLAIGMSFAPLLVFYLNLAGVKITLLNVVWEVFIIIVVACLVIWRRSKG